MYETRSCKNISLKYKSTKGKSSTENLKAWVYLVQRQPRVCEIWNSKLIGPYFILSYRNQIKKLYRLVIL